MKFDLPQLICSALEHMFVIVERMNGYMVDDACTALWGGDNAAAAGSEVMIDR